MFPWRSQVAVDDDRLDRAKAIAHMLSMFFNGHVFPSTGAGTGDAVHGCQGAPSVPANTSAAVLAPMSAHVRLVGALEYASQGWPVLPCELRGKRPAGALVPHGLKDASTDLDVVAGCWKAEPDLDEQPGVFCEEFAQFGVVMTTRSLNELLGVKTGSLS